MKTIAVSGGFDPIHIGHLRMFEHCAKYGALQVILNTDAWLLRKKGYVFMPFEERAELLKSYRFIKLIVPARDDDDTVCESLRILKPTIFANGGDRTKINTPEMKLCEELGIKMMWGAGGEFKAQSSSELVRRAMASLHTYRPTHLLYEDKN